MDGMEGERGVLRACLLAHGAPDACSQPTGQPVNHVVSVPARIVECCRNTLWTSFLPLTGFRPMVRIGDEAKKGVGVGWGRCRLLI